MMRIRVFASLLAALLLITTACGTGARAQEPWQASQLMAPATLAQMIQAGKAPVILNIGPSGAIKGSVAIGATHESKNMNRLRSQLATLPKDAEVVLYCGCCPFADCPNIRPAFALLNELKFKQPRLLNIERNLKVNWIDKGYPMAD